MTCPFCDCRLFRTWKDELPVLHCQNGHRIEGIGDLISFLLDRVEHDDE